MRLKITLFVVLLSLIIDNAVAQDYILDADSVKYEGYISKAMPRSVKIGLRGKNKDQVFTAGSIKGYFDDMSSITYISKKVLNADEDDFIFIPKGKVISEESTVKFYDGNMKCILNEKVSYLLITTYGGLVSYGGKVSGRSVITELYLENDKVGLKKIPFGFLGDKLETSKILLEYFRDNRSIVTKINTGRIKNTANGIKELVQEYISSNTTTSNN
ncbi:hypothetical protein NF867_02995 [Solitalea sp. MAHUQ-68]|uniref:DUF4468 domain-containing protein n=1 Tax=Solitalea agri TaxID=2953739 RepID=A0A9X2F3R0_9SPHI|nr:hypothetical protein [Solitalea agri]MCO4291826.1 hypothetical protein [Solitalea agri]